MAIDLTKNSSPGLDQVTNKMIKCSPPNFGNLLLLTLNDSIIHHTYPAEWNEFLIVLIPKKKKKKKRKPIYVRNSCIMYPQADGKNSSN